MNRQMLFGVITKAVESAIGEHNVKSGRQLATFLEKQALKLRATLGFNPRNPPPFASPAAHAANIEGGLTDNTATMADYLARHPEDAT